MADLRPAVEAVFRQEGGRIVALVDRLGASRTLDGYRLFHAARADLLRRLGRPHDASEAYRKALALTTNRVEQAYLRRRAAALG